MRHQISGEHVSEGIFAGNLRDLIAQDPLYPNVKRGGEFYC